MELTQLKEQIEMNELLQTCMNLLDPEFPQENIPQIKMDLVQRPNFCNIVLTFVLYENNFSHDIEKYRKQIEVSLLKLLFQVFTMPTNDFVNFPCLDLAKQYFEKKTEFLYEMAIFIAYLDPQSFPEYLSYFYELISSNFELNSSKFLFLLTSICQYDFHFFYYKTASFLQEILNSQLFYSTNYNSLFSQAVFTSFNCYYSLSNSDFQNTLEKDQKPIEIAMKILTFIDQSVCPQIIPDNAFNAFNEIVKYITTVLRILLPYNDIEEEKKNLFQQLFPEIYPLFIDFCLNILKKDPYQSSETCSLIIKELHDRIEFVDSSFFQSLIEICLLGLNTIDIEGSIDNPPQFYGLLFDKNYKNCEINDCRMQSTLLLHTLFKNEKDSFIQIIFQNDEVDSTTKIYIFSSFIQRLIDNNEIIEENFKGNLQKIAEYLSQLDESGDDFKNVIFQLMQLYFASILPYFGVGSEFPYDITSIDPDNLSTIEQSALSLYFRLISNSIKMGFDDFKTSEILNFLKVNSSLCLDDCANTGFSLLVRFLPEEAAQTINEDILTILTTIKEKLSMDLSEEDSTSFQDYLNQYIPILSSYIESAPNCIDTGSILPLFYEILNSLYDTSFDYDEFLIAPIGFVKSKETIVPFVLFYLLPIIETTDFDYVLDSLLRPLSVSLDTNYQAFDMDIGDGLLLSHKFLQVIIQRFSEGQEGNFPFETNDLESLVLVLIQIIEKTSELPQDLLNPLIELISQRILIYEHPNNVDLISFFLLMSSICTRYFYIPSDDIINKWISCCDIGCFFTNYMRCLTGIGFLTLSTKTDYRKQELNERGNALILNQNPKIDINSEEFSSFSIFISNSEPDFRLLLGFPSNFVIDDSMNVV